MSLMLSSFVPNEAGTPSEEASEKEADITKRCVYRKACKEEEVLYALPSVLNRRGDSIRKHAKKKPHPQVKLGEIVSGKKLVSLNYVKA